MKKREIWYKTGFSSLHNVLQKAQSMYSTREFGYAMLHKSRLTQLILDQQSSNRRTCFYAHAFSASAESLPWPNIVTWAVKIAFTFYGCKTWLKIWYAYFSLLASPGTLNSPSHHLKLLQHQCNIIAAKGNSQNTRRKWIMQQVNKRSK